MFFCTKSTIWNIFTILGQYFTFPFINIPYVYFVAIFHYRVPEHSNRRSSHPTHWIFWIIAQSQCSDAWKCGWCWNGHNWFASQATFWCSRAWGILLRLFCQYVPWFDIFYYFILSLPFLIDIRKAWCRFYILLIVSEGSALPKLPISTKRLTLMQREPIATYSRSS